MAFDVAKITLDQQHKYLGDPPSKAPTPATLRLLLGSLKALTDELEKHARAAREESFWGTTPAGAWWTDFRRWQKRLDTYISIAQAASSDDIQATLWSVTAPLLLGQFGGKEAEGEKFKTPDISSPFILWNQVEVEDQSRKDAWEAFKKDIKDPLKIGFGGVALLIVGAVLLSQLGGKSNDRE